MNYQGEKKTGSDGKEHWYRDGREYQLMKKTDTEMGKISNLITDMTIIGATDDEVARAVRHSMVVLMPRNIIWITNRVKKTITFRH